MPAMGGKPPVEPEFAQRHIAVERVGGNGADRRHQPERDRQIVMAALLGQVGRREIDGDALGRQRQARRPEAPSAPARRLSATALSGRPTMVKPTTPGAICTCTSTGTASMP